MVAAQQAPNASLQLELFARPPSPLTTFRHDFCYLSDAIRQGNLTLEKALDGVAIHPALHLGEFVKLDGTDPNTLTLNADYPGLTVQLLDEICLRAGCTWRNTFAALGSLQGNQTFFDLLLWTTDTYDVSVDWWMRSVDRLRAGVTFAEPWYDATIIMVTRQEG